MTEGATVLLSIIGLPFAWIIAAYVGLLLTRWVLIAALDTACFIIDRTAKK